MSHQFSFSCMFDANFFSYSYLLSFSIIELQILHYSRMEELGVLFKNGKYRQRDKDPEVLQVIELEIKHLS